MEENKNKEQGQIVEKDQEQQDVKVKEKAYPIRNFVKEIKRVSWPTSKKNYKYFFWIFVFIIFLIAFFALISWGATELIKAMGAN